MAELQVGLLYKLATSLPTTSINSTQLLKSYYLMRCKELTSGYGLPDKHFSYKVRCAHCCTEWQKGTERKIQSIKLSKSQRRRIRNNYKQENSKKTFEKLNLLTSKELVQTCYFCKKNTITTVLEPEKCKVQTKKSIDSNKELNTKNIDSSKKVMSSDKVTNKKKKTNKSKKIDANKSEINVYSNTKDIFSLKNKMNILAKSVKEQPKVILNNKKKKDKYAGLCQKAVQSAKEIRDKSNKINLFLKPSN